MDRYDFNSYLDFLKIIYDEDMFHKDYKHIEKLSKQVHILAEGSMDRPKMDLLYFLICFQGLWKRKAITEELEFKIRMFLAALDWSEEEIEDAFFSLERHLTKPIHLEEKIVYDANYIELLNANIKLKNTINNKDIENIKDNKKMLQKEEVMGKAFGSVVKNKANNLQEKRLNRLKKEI